MKTSEKDKNLKKMIKGIRLESPGPDFSSKVMEAILVETQKKPGFVTEPFLGKKFWILVTLFIVLAIVFMLFYKAEPGSGSVQNLFSALPSPDWSPFKNLFSSFIGQAGSLSWTLIMVTLGATGLIFADKIFVGKHLFSLR
jgi:hypothetical protein